LAEKYSEYRFNTFSLNIKHLITQSQFTNSQLNMNINSINWESIKNDLDEQGYAVIPSLIPTEICSQLIASYTQADLYRSTIVMKRYNFGKGEYKYFAYPLPESIAYLRNEMYSPLSKVANEWNQKLGIHFTYPEKHADFIEACRQQNQCRPTPLILKYEKGDFNTLHQDLYGDLYFPFQAVLFLTQVNEDYTGGEFVLIEQKPRLQSQAIVLQPNRGDMVIFTTNFRAAKGTRGYFRSPMKHGVSKLHSGNRYTVGIIFHDAK